MTDAALGSLEPLPIVIPVVGAVLAPVAARVSRRLPLVISVLAMAASAGVLAILCHRVYTGHLVVHYLGHVGPVDGHALGIALAADPFGLTYALLAAALGTLLVLFSLSSMRELGSHELGGYACLYQLLLAGLIGSALTADLFDLFVWFEVSALASYGLTGFFLARPFAVEAAFKILVLTTIAGFGIFIGTGLIYDTHGALNLGQIHVALGSGAHSADLVALALLVAGFATKAGIVPFHGWLPDAHTAAPGPVSALFSGLMVNLGVVAIVRLTLQVYGSAGRPVLGLVTVLGAVSAVMGAVLALAQDDLKRLLAYDTVSQMGVLLVGFANRSASGVGGATYHLINHALFKALLFLCAGSIVHATGKEKLSEMGGLARARPVTTAAFLVGAAAIAGIPPLNGYASVGLIHDALLHDEPAAYSALLVAQVVTIAALARAAYLAFFRPRASDYDDLERLHPGMLTAFLALCGGCVAFGAMPGLVIRNVVAPATAWITTSGAYASGVLARRGTLAPADVHFDYWSATELLTVVGTVAAGLLLAWWYTRHEEPRLVTGLRALHNGSVNDYTSYAAFGFVVAAGVVLIGHP
ncbi:MAG TPA: proton-conducting transporter membrane subunit [Mycobacteriales bacterium]|nr:proton-conducting transporter membrane subunit [Mycobacteriales bacterium]